jgi:hypothetical protein
MPRNTTKRLAMPLLFWLPLIVLSGMLSVAQRDAETLYRINPQPRR